MPPPKLCFIFGTRPEAIKLAPIIRLARQDPRFQVEVCVTGQHRQMLDQVLSAFGIVPDFDLNLMLPNQTLADLTARLLSALDAHLRQSRPDLILIQGDTTTVLAAALAGFYQRVPVAHVEAGLRTGNLESPFPEEANRVLTSRLASLHFAPTVAAAQVLLGEGIPTNRVFVTGNSVIDALLFMVDEVTRNPPIVPDLPSGFLEGDRPFVLITAHRRENFGLPFEQICRAIATLADRHPEIGFVFPVHLNPQVRKPVQQILGDHRSNLALLEPQGYREFIELFRRCRLVLTDSGGIQEEAPTLGKPVLVMRDTTERPEGVAAGAVRIVGSQAESIVATVEELLQNPKAYKTMIGKENPYGDGSTAQQILNHCAEFLASDVRSRSR